MKRFIALLIVILVIVPGVLITTGCNKQLIDTTFHFDSAMLELPDGTVVSGTVESWRDFEDGDQIRVKINGKTYLVHSENICMMTQ